MSDKNLPVASSINCHCCCVCHLLLCSFSQDYDLRKHARNDGRRYCDPVVLTYQAERMPEQIRLKVGGVTPHQIAVYEEFARNIPGFMSTAQEAREAGPYMTKTMQVIL